MTKRSLFDSLRDFLAGAPEPATAQPPGPAPVPERSDRATDAALAGDWKERVPRSSLDRVVLIRDQLDGLQRATAERGMQTEHDELGRIRETHLPRLLQSYIEIPAEHRAEVFRETGKSASFLLNDSLDKMLARLRDISAQCARGNITTFAENIRFVDLYYENQKGPFD